MIRYGLLIRLLGTLLVLTLFDVGALNGFRHTITDARFRAASRPATGKVAIVEIDEASLSTLGTWPWSRSVHAALLDRLHALGAADIAFDVDFSSPRDPAGDDAFRKALDGAGGSVILAALQQQGSHGSTNFVESHPLGSFLDVAWEASVNVEPDRDGLIRALAFGGKFGSTAMPNLPFVLSGSSGVAQGDYLVDYGIDIDGIDRLSAADVYSGHVDPERVRNKKIIIGATAIELRDFYQVPRFGVISGALLQGLAADGLMQGRALQAIDPAVSLMLCLAILILAWLARRLDMAKFIVLSAALAATIEGAAIAIQRTVPLILDTSPVHVEILLLAVIAVMLEVDSRRIKILVSRGHTERLRAILDRVVADNFAGIVVVDQDGIVRAVSRAAADLFGVDRDVAGRHATQILPFEMQAILVDALKQTAEGELLTPAPRQVEVRLRPRGEPAVIEYVTTVSAMPRSIGESGRAVSAQTVVCLTFQDVTERRRSEARIERLAHFDGLTGLANRHSFLSRLNEMIEAPRPEPMSLGVLCIDLDRFKIVNDRLGTDWGDALLRSVADRIRAGTEPDDVLARLSGNEFALVLARRDADTISALAHDLVAALGGDYELGAYQVTVSARAGLAFAECAADELMKRADAALSAAKLSGGGCVRIYDVALAQTAEAGRMLELDLRDAVSRNELRVFYQRQVDTVTEAIIGVEALVRWEHPRLGFVSPTAFIPIAERTGMIDEIGAWVMRIACRDAMSWSKPIKVSVNLSAVQLSRGDIVQTVAQALAESGLPPARLDLELTESLLLDNAGFARGALDRVRQLGVGLSLDDFGTGYSSLSYLKDFDIDKIKIDRSFVMDLPRDQSSIAIIRAVVTLAQTLGLRVNTEGVETVEQLALLRSLGCDEVQGYLHGRPEPSAAIERSLRALGGRRDDDQPLPLAS